MRRPLVRAIAAAWALILFRSAVFILYQQSLFDSDQAVVGLMAKHLIEGRAFPLFFYGQTFLLGVEAWAAALVFLVAGSTVAALHTAQMAWNLVAATLVIVGLVRWGGLSPWLALVASLFFTLAPPFTSILLIEANGCNIEPFLYVPLLWMLRDRPLWFGAVLGVGFLNREFTIYAVPVLLAVQLLTGTLFQRDRLRTWLVAAAVFLAVTQAVDALKPFADPMGPGTRGQLVRGSGGSVVGNLSARMEFGPGDLVPRSRLMLMDYFPRQIGLHAIDSATAPQGREWLFWPIGGLLLVALARVALLTWTSRRAVWAPKATAFAWYLAGVGALSAIGYIVSRPPEYGLVDRYMLLTLYGPVGVLGLLLALEPRVWLKRTAVALMIVWAGVSAMDHGRLFARYWRGGEPDSMQELADALVARGITVAAAPYWRAYRATFLARERVKIASTDFNRIEEYQELARREGPALIVLQTEPCQTDLAPIGYWYLCRRSLE